MSAITASSATKITAPASSSGAALDFIQRQILHAFLDADEPDLCKIAEELKLTVSKVADWAESPATAQKLEKLANIFELRARVLVAQALPKAIRALTRTIEQTEFQTRLATPKEENRAREICRRAATTLIRLFSSSSSPVPKPARSPTFKPTQSVSQARVQQEPTEPAKNETPPLSLSSYLPPSLIAAPERPPLQSLQSRDAAAAHTASVKNHILSSLPAHLPTPKIHPP